MLCLHSESFLSFHVGRAAAPPKVRGGHLLEVLVMFKLAFATCGNCLYSVQ